MTANSDDNAGDLLEMATSCLRSNTSPRWERAAAILARQAIESSARGALAARSQTGVDRVSMRGVFIALSVVIESPSVQHAYWAWSTLSEFCHHSVYELPPPSNIIGACIEAGREFRVEVEEEN